jgi:hypothetical protein
MPEIRGTTRPNRGTNADESGGLTVDVTWRVPAYRRGLKAGLGCGMLSVKNSGSWIKTGGAMPLAGRFVRYRTSSYQQGGYVDAWGAWHHRNGDFEKNSVLEWCRLPGLS